MSIFKDKGVVLKIKKIDSKNQLYTILTSNYGKILCNKSFSKKEKSLDIGYLINFEIDVKKGLNIFNIKNIKILSEFESMGQKYSIINNFLELINIVHLKLPEKLANFEIFETLENLIKYKNINSSKIILIKLKLLNILGVLNLENKNITIKKILHFINKNKSSNILKLTGISKDIEEELYCIVERY